MTGGKRFELTNAATDDHLLPLIQYSSLYHPSASSPSSAVTLYLFFIYTIISSLPCPLCIMLAILFSYPFLSSPVVRSISTFVFFLHFLRASGPTFSPSRLALGMGRWKNREGGREKEVDLEKRARARGRPGREGSVCVCVCVFV